MGRHKSFQNFYTILFSEQKSYKSRNQQAHYTTQMSRIQQGPRKGRLPVMKGSILIRGIAKEDRRNLRSDAGLVSRAYWQAGGRIHFNPRQFWLILPEATAIRLGLSHASLGACRKASTGGRLSNTWTTCPREGDNPGKLGLNPHRGWILECSISESPQGARGWVCGGLGSWWGNGPPSLRSVRAMGVGARRWTLRQGSRPYGAQQARNLRNAGNRDEVSRSAGARIGCRGV